MRHCCGEAADEKPESESKNLDEFFVKPIYHGKRRGVLVSAMLIGVG